jgi:hypothetical protein
VTDTFWQNSVVLIVSLATQNLMNLASKSAAFTLNFLLDQIVAASKVLRHRAISISTLIGLCAIL